MFGGPKTTGAHRWLAEGLEGVDDTLIRAPVASTGTGAAARHLRAPMISWLLKSPRRRFRVGVAESPRTSSD